MTDRKKTKRPIVKKCPICGAEMDYEKAWWFTAYGATDTENCARLLVEEVHDKYGG